MSAGDGIAEDSGGFLPNQPAPERAAGQYTGDDLSWVGGPKGHQPITSTNPDGDMPGVSPMAPDFWSVFGPQPG